MFPRCAATLIHRKTYSKNSLQRVCLQQTVGYYIPLGAFWLTSLFVPIIELRLLWILVKQAFGYN